MLLRWKMCPGPLLGGPWKSWLRVGPRKFWVWEKALEILESKLFVLFQLWRSETTPEWIKNDKTNNLQQLQNSAFWMKLQHKKHQMHFQDKLNYCWLRELWLKVFVFFLQWLLLLLISFLEKVDVWESFHLAYLVVVFMLLWRHEITKDV